VRNELRKGVEHDDRREGKGKKSEGVSQVVAFRGGVEREVADDETKRNEEGEKGTGYISPSQTLPSLSSGEYGFPQPRLHP